MVQFLKYKILVRKPHRKLKRRLKIRFSETGRKNVYRINPDLDMCQWQYELGNEFSPSTRDREFLTSEVTISFGRTIN